MKSKCFEKINERYFSKSEFSYSEYELPGEVSNRKENLLYLRTYSLRSIHYPRKFKSSQNKAKRVNIERKWKSFYKIFIPLLFEILLKKLTEKKKSALHKIEDLSIIRKTNLSKEKEILFQRYIPNLKNVLTKIVRRDSLRILKLCLIKAIVN